MEYSHRTPNTVTRLFRGSTWDKVDSDKPLAPMNWAQRLKRVFAIDIEKCAECGGKLRVIACIEDPLLIRQILSHVQQRDGPADFDARGPPGEAIVA